MIVLLVSECTGPARQKTQRILDDFLPRIGRRTWEGNITQQGLQRLKNTLARSATKSTSVVCRHHDTKKSSKVLWVVGNRTKFNLAGHCSIKETAKAHSLERIATDPERFLGYCIALASLFHDLGKASVWFQKKLRGKLGSGPIADPIRHEIISCMVLNASMEGHENDDSWLESFATPEKAAVSLERAFSDVSKSPERFLEGVPGPKSNSAPNMLKMVTGNTKFVFEKDEARLAFSCIHALVLTHHRLPDGDAVQSKVRARLTNIGERGPDHIRKESFEAEAKLKPEAALKSLFTFHSKHALWSDPTYLRDVSNVASELRKAKPSYSVEMFRLATVYGRLAIILGDHKASQIGNTRFPMESRPTLPDQIFANTNSADQRLLAEPLGSHLSRVSREARRAYELVVYKSDEFPSLLSDELPETISHPRSGNNDKFKWQCDARRITRKAFKNAPDNAGFFGVMMGGTGSGKTRASAIVMGATALKSGGLRLSVTSGLRSLTLQAGLEYQEDLGFKKEDVSVVIGDALTKELFESASTPKHKALGTDSDHMLEDEVIQIDRDVPTRPLPALAQRLLGSSIESGPAKLNAAPILVSTVDTLMPAADAKRGGHTPQMLRVATSDLIIDEIDDFGGEDLVALARLVHLSGMFGRKVLICSATITPVIAHTLFHAYRSGRVCYTALNSGSDEIICGWYSERREQSCELVNTDESFRSFHDDFARSVVEKLEKSASKRKVRVAKISAQSVPEMFEQLGDHINVLHDSHNVTDPASGRKLSVGVIRWSNVSPSMQHAKFLAKHGVEGLDLRVVPYNGTLLPVYRHLLETAINPMLKRSYRNNSDPILSNPNVRKLLDNGNNDDACIVIVTTSMEEVGRDHDFDWVITEPGSARGLVQMAGRCLRHRDISPSNPNILIMEKSYREISKLDHDKNSRVPFFAFPGIETPYTTSNHKTVRLAQINSHSVDDLYDLSVLSHSVDARDLITPDVPCSRLAQLERHRLEQFLVDGIANDPCLTVEDFTGDRIAFVTSRHAKGRPFRRQSGKNGNYVYRYGTRHDDGWTRITEKPIRVSGKYSEYVKDIEITQSRLLFEFEVEEVEASKLANSLWGEEDIAQWRREQLLTIERPERGDVFLKYRYNRHLGFVRFKCNESRTFG